MGLFGKLLGENKAAVPPQLRSIYPPSAAMKIRQGILPEIQSDKLLLAKNEKCRYVESGAIITEQKTYRSRHNGGSFRVWKGFTYHRGESKSVPEYEREYTKGILFFTDKRIVFVAGKNGFEQKLSKLTSVTEYSNAIELQFGNKTYRVLLPDGCLAKDVLDLLT